MRHPDDDTLLKEVLNLLEMGEREKLTVHIATCASCQRRLRSLERETEMIGSLEPDIPSPSIALPGPGKNRLSQLVRVAALLLVGFLSGYGFSQMSYSPELTVIPSYQRASAPPQTIQQFSVCESLNLDVEAGHTPLLD